ncbi:MAG: hypothetical protein AAFN30_20505, partial [Actinomycetota bacterium]
MTAGMDRGAPGWRLPLAIVLVVVNVGLIGANLNKHDLFPFSDGTADDVVSGDTTSTSTSVTTTDTTALATDEGSTTEDEPDVDDWPGGRGPVPEGPAQPRRVALSAETTSSAVPSLKGNRSCLFRLAPIKP